MMANDYTTRPSEEQIAAERAGRLAALIRQELTHATPGHCVRVDFLDNDEAEAICGQLRSAATLPGGTKLQVHLLAGARDAIDNPLALTADRAIELRNRKKGCLCLFVPAGLIDAAVTSLGNSFAQIDGRYLHSEALDRVLAELQPDTRDRLHAIRVQLTGSARASNLQVLDLSLAALALEQQGALDRLGLELWRVGLITDARPDFEAYLSANKSAVRKLARPQQLSASYRDRILTLGVRQATARRLEAFFGSRSLHDVQDWSRELLEPEMGGESLTFDGWKFEDVADTDLESVRLRPFTDPAGSVLKTSKLLQPDGPGGILYARCGFKKAMTVHWETEPLKPQNVYQWRVTIEPAVDEEDLEAVEFLFDLPARDIGGEKRTARIKLDLQFDEPTETAVRVRVVAIDVAGNEVIRDAVPIEAVSEEFYLTDRMEAVAPGTSQRRRTVPNLAIGRLQAALDVKEETIKLTQPQWSHARDALYFSTRANERTILNVATSQLLVDIQRRTIQDPRQGGRYELKLDEVRAATMEDIATLPPPETSGERWDEFWQARKTFFERLRRAHPRDVLEAADWTSDLTNAALRQAATYGELLSRLETAGEEPARRAALKLDTLYLRVEAGAGGDESIVVLPTHPLRALWLSAHAALLRHWEERVLQLARKDRRRLLDASTIQEIVPANLPAFIPGERGAQLFIFFHNLGMHLAVAFQPGVPDPRRRFHDVAQILGLQTEVGAASDERPERLASHLRNFCDSHRYADPLEITLVNPDQGDFLASAVDHLLGEGPRDEDGEPATAPRFNIRAYVGNDAAPGLSGLDRLRSLLQERTTRRATDHLQPALTSAVLPKDELTRGNLADSHVTIVADTSRTLVEGMPDEAPEGVEGSFSLYGLLTRFVSSFSGSDYRVDWIHRVVASPTDKPEPHPAGPRFGETLVGAHRAYLRASGALLGEDEGPVVPGIRVRLDSQQVTLLEQLHAHADWVITLDRFFGVEYYDSPQDPRLRDVARKYLIDYAPEFTEGLGHRIIVTTSRRDEVAGILRRAMDELGFVAVESSVTRLLGHLKTVSGRLALRTLSRDTHGAAAVSLGVVTAWLQAQGRLSEGVLVPVDLHRDLFWTGGPAAIAAGQRRCDLALFTLRRGIVEATFVEVKWRRGPLGNIEDLAEDMRLQMQSTGRAVEDRFFGPDRVDGALQRARLANVLRFYANRALRYGLLNPETAATFGSHVSRLEKASLEFRPRYEGFVVSLEDPGRPPYVADDVTIRVLTAKDFETEDIALPAAEGGTSSSVIDVGLATTSTVETEDATGPPSLPETTETPPLTLNEESDPSDSEEEAGQECVSITLGQSAGSEVVWQPSVQGSPHLFITGIPGQGKSWTTLRVLRELHAQRVPALVFDFHGQLAGENQYTLAAKPTVVDASQGLPFSPFESSGDDLSPSGMKATADAIADIFTYVCDLGDIQRDALYQCIRGAYSSVGWESDTASDEPRKIPTMSDLRRRIDRMEQAQRTHNLSARCRSLLEMDLFRPPAEGSGDFIATARGGLVVDLHNLYSEALQMAAGAFLLRKVYRDMFGWGMADRVRLAIVLDEAHRLAKDATLPKIMKEGRKYGIVVLLASQGLGDFHPDVPANAGTKIAFRANFPESRKVAGYFHVRQAMDARTILEGLSVGHALVQTPDMTIAARVAMYPP